MGYSQLDNGMMWPSADIDCKAVVFNSKKDMDYALYHVRSFDVAIQAGGNCGVWALELAKKFDTVYTFEPDHENFTCLAYNTRESKKIIRMQAALGNVHGQVRLIGESRNCGAYQIEYGGTVPVFRIDDLMLESCGFIMLDIEGAEPDAFQGAAETIRKYSPVLMYEDKGLSEKYGYPKGWVEEWAADEFGYSVVKRINRDVILRK